MAATTFLEAGYIQTMVQNQVYGLPSQVVFVQASASVEVGMTDGTTGFTLLTNANTVGAPTAAPFIRATTGTTTICVKRYQ